MPFTDTQRLVEFVSLGFHENQKMTNLATTTPSRTPFILYLLGAEGLTVGHWADRGSYLIAGLVAQIEKKIL
jgi:hypothetical protein